MYMREMSNILMCYLSNGYIIIFDLVAVVFHGFVALI